MRACAFDDSSKNFFYVAPKLLREIVVLPSFVRRLRRVRFSRYSCIFRITSFFEKERWHVERRHLNLPLRAPGQLSIVFIYAAGRISRANAKRNETNSVPTRRAAPRRVLPRRIMERWKRPNVARGSIKAIKAKFTKGVCRAFKMPHGDTSTRS